MGTEPATELLAVIDAPHFYAGVVLREDRVIEAAPIVKYMHGWSQARVRVYCKSKGWHISVVFSVQQTESGPCRTMN